MRGVNCAVVGCSTSYRTKEIEIFKFPAAKMINTKSGGKNGSPKTRVIDKAFREKILNDTAYICEKHFKAEDIELCRYTLILSHSFSFWTVFSGLLVVGLSNH